VGEFLKTTHPDFPTSRTPQTSVRQVDSDSDNWQNQPQPVFDRRETPEGRRRREEFEKELQLKTQIEALPIHKAADVICVENSQQAKNSVSKVIGTHFCTDIVQEYEPENGVDKPRQDLRWVQFDPQIHGYSPKYFPEGRYVALDFSFIKCEKQDCTCSLHESFKYRECAIYVPSKDDLAPTIQFFNHDTILETTV
jgi:hypothetical protein